MNERKLKKNEIIDYGITMWNRRTSERGKVHTIQLLV